MRPPVESTAAVISCIRFFLSIAIFLKSGAKIQQKKAEVKTSAKMIKKMNKMMQFLSV
jgi:hypothetical protein